MKTADWIVFETTILISGEAIAKELSKPRALLAGRCCSADVVLCWWLRLRCVCVSAPPLWRESARRAGAVAALAASRRPVV